jgi:putative lipoprotein
MKIEVKVMLRNQVLLPETAVCRVEVRDVSLLDAPSITVCSHQSPATKVSGITLLTEILEVPDNDLVGRNLNIWAHLSLTGSKRVQSGDYITMQAYPIITTVSAVSVVVELQLVR